MAKTVADILREARAMISQPDGWGVGWHHPTSAATTWFGPRCIIEALTEAGDQGYKAQTALNRIANGPIWKVNDHQGLAAVLSVIDLAIAQEEQLTP